MTTLDWTTIRLIGTTDGIGRWYPNESVAAYFKDLRPPSRAWPYSYAKAAQTAKFAKWLWKERPVVAEMVFGGEPPPTIHINARTRKHPAITIAGAHQY